MVTITAQPPISPSLNGTTTKTPEPAAGRDRTLGCRRCDTRLVQVYDEPQCLSCGFADYRFTERANVHDRTNLLSAATRYVFRYVGDAPQLVETLAHVRVVRIRNRIGFRVTCPFCDTYMEESSLSGKRPEAREQRFKCGHGHRVSLVPRKNGMTGWR